MSFFAQVAVLSALPRTLTYRIPESLAADAQIGRLAFVLVRGALNPSFIISVSSEMPTDCGGRTLSEISSFAPFPSFFDEKLLDFYRFTASYYGVPLGMVLKTAFPRLGRYTIRETLSAGSDDLPAAVLEAVTGGTILSARELRAQFPDLSAAQIRAFETSGMLQRVRTPRFTAFRKRDLAYLDDADDRLVELTAEQRGICDELQSREGGPPCLVIGKTGSGKTELLLTAAAETIGRGRSVLYLVPEISMAPHIYRRATALVDKERVLVWHSSVSNATRALTFQILLTKPCLVIGTRSSIFLPLYVPGLIIVDEEHDGSYKHEGALPYNARDLAIMRGKTFAHPIVLSSATPSVETYHGIATGRITVRRLTGRFSPRKPELTVVDMRNEQPIAGFFSRQLMTAITENLGRREQSMVFINRRGYAPYIYCNDCRNFILCKNCSIPLTWHKDKSVFLCHRCGRSVPTANTCPSCASHNISYFGAGTERVAELLSTLFPEAKLLKVDRDATEDMHFFRKHLSAIIDGSYDILVGTQILAKGHHFPKLTLVGVLMGDQGLSLPDFRAGERSFQLLTQVLGRAGRELPGRVIIQTSYPEAPSLQYALNEDAEAFCQRELDSRKETFFPPFSRLLLIRVSSPDENDARTAAVQIGALIRSSGRAKDLQVMPPAPAPVFKEKGKYRYQVFVRAASAQLLVRTGQHIRSAYKAPASCRVSFDMDPYNLL